MPKRVLFKAAQVEAGNPEALCGALATQTFLKCCVQVKMCLLSLQYMDNLRVQGLCKSETLVLCIKDIFNQLIPGQATTSLKPNSNLHLDKLNGK